MQLAVVFVACLGAVGVAVPYIGETWVACRASACAAQTRFRSVAEHAVVTRRAVRSCALQSSAASLQDSAQSPSASGPEQGSPALAHVPAWHVSLPEQKSPSSRHAVPFGSCVVQLSASSLHASLQSASPSPMVAAHGSPDELPHPPAVHVSVPLQKALSSQAEPSGSAAVHMSAASSHDSLQSKSASPTFAAQGSPVGLPQTPAVHVSVPLQNEPSSQALRSGSLAMHASAPSLHDSEQSASASPTFAAQGSPVGLPHTPAVHDSVPLQNVPSSHARTVWIVGGAAVRPFVARLAAIEVRVPNVCRTRITRGTSADTSRAELVACTEKAVGTARCVWVLRGARVSRLIARLGAIRVSIADVDRTRVTGRIATHPGGARFHTITERTVIARRAIGVVGGTGICRFVTRLSAIRVGVANIGRAWIACRAATRAGGARLGAGAKQPVITAQAVESSSARAVGGATSRNAAGLAVVGIASTATGVATHPVHAIVAEAIRSEPTRLAVVELTHAAVACAVRAFAIRIGARRHVGADAVGSTRLGRRARLTGRAAEAVAADAVGAEAADALPADAAALAILVLTSPTAIARFACETLDIGIVVRWDRGARAIRRTALREHACLAREVTSSIATNGVGAVHADAFVIPAAGLAVDPVACAAPVTPAIRAFDVRISGRGDGRARPIGDPIFRQ